MKWLGSSTGGGKILVTRVNGMAVKFTGQYPTLITRHQDRPGIIASISGLLAQHSINILSEVFRSAGAVKPMVMETDQPVSNEIIEKLSNIEGVHEVLLIDCSIFKKGRRWHVSIPRGQDLLKLCEQHNMSIAEIMLQAEASELGWEVERCAAISRHRLRLWKNLCKGLNAEIKRLGAHWR